MHDSTKTIRFASLAPFALILVSFFWGATFPWVKKALIDFSPLYWVAIRFLLASMLFGIVYAARRGARRKGIKEGLILGLVLGSAFVLQTTGIKLSSAATMGLLTGLILPFIYIFETFVARNRLEMKVKLCLVLAFTGFILISYEGGMRFHTADILGIVASLGFAFQIFLTGKFASRCSITTLNFYQMLMISVMGFFMAEIFEDFRALNFKSTVGISSIIFTAVFCSFFAFFMQTWAQRFVSPAKTTLLFSLEPLFAVIISWIVYFEEITSMKIVGAILLLAAVAVVQIKGRETRITKDKAQYLKVDDRQVECNP